VLIKFLKPLLYLNHSSVLGMYVEVLLGVDLGTTTCKAVAYDVSGRKLIEYGVEYPTYYPKPLWAEQDPNDWFNSFVRAVRYVSEWVLRRGYDIRAMCITSQREGVVPLSRDGRALSNCITWMDCRSLPQAEWIAREVGVEEVYRRTGLRVAVTFTATKLLWLKENQPEVYEKTWCFLQPKEYINYLITGVACSDPSLASRTMMFNINSLKWDEDLISAYGLTSDKLPNVRKSSDIIGYLKDDVSKLLGIGKSIPVINGGGDRPCEALGAGIISEGILGESTGTATNVMASIDRPILDVKMRILCSCHVLPGKWLLEGGTTPTGAILRWFRDELGVDEVRKAGELGVDPYVVIDEEASKIPPCSDGLILLPFFMGSKATRWNPHLRGALIGLTLSHKKAHIARSIMEGIAYLAREVLDAIREMGVPINEIRLLGGAAKSRLWAEIKASVWNTRVHLLNETSTAPLGAAILAGLGVGIFKNYEDAVRTMVRLRDSITPINEWVGTYSKCYENYLKLADALERVLSTSNSGI